MGSRMELEDIDTYSDQCGPEVVECIIVENSTVRPVRLVSSIVGSCNSA